jgi:hypothetical protein
MADFALNHFLSFILLIGVGMVVAFALMAYLLLRLGRKFGGEKAAMAIGVVLVGLVLFGMYDVIHTCNKPPVFTPSQCDEWGRNCQSERATFECDGPGGAIDYAFAYLFYPAAAALVGFLTFRVTRRSSQSKANA